LRLLNSQTKQLSQKVPYSITLH